MILKYSYWNVASQHWGQVEQPTNSNCWNWSLSWMVGIWHWHITTFIITDTFPPWRDFVMVGICRQAIIIIIVVITIITIIITRAFAKLLCLCCPGRCLSRLWTKWKRRLEEEKKVRMMKMIMMTIDDKNTIWDGGSTAQCSIMKLNENIINFELFDNLK